ncbi:NAD(+) diphosphatase [Niveibacterium umoris]|uniref:NAD(+) diphosphatase n=1 Tax=Niveibacterium umoris TaxID=1193620 RepID=A0A840BNE4_9RHOO|nr:NAD(+) diphosphatase [Niveibacterium umoris]MBB4014094.1 NAD+ diphosphatase [Niveibacterium umoris]
MLLPADFEPLWSCDRAPLPEDLWFVFQDSALLVQEASPACVLPDGAVLRASGVVTTECRCVGKLGAAYCWVASIADRELPVGLVAEPVRRLFNRLPDDLLAIAGRAQQILEFDRTHRYCGACAAEMRAHDGGRARACPACGHSAYPRIAPAMMVLVKRDGPGGRELLLAHGAKFPGTMYSALAGFVEPSESLEACIRRETREEVGVEVCNLRYFGSQGWPFPHSLMVAFVADWAGGEIACQPDEIVDAQWFALDALPQLPHRLSIARRLINAVVGECDPQHPVLTDNMAFPQPPASA